MARRKFPSDDRHWFRVTEDIVEDPKLAQLSGDEFRAYFHLLAMLNRSGTRDGAITVSPRALMAMTCRRTVTAALRLLENPAAVGLLRLHCEPAAASQRPHSGLTAARIAVPNWSKIQGFTPATRGEERRGEEKERETPKTPAATPPPATPKPDLTVVPCGDYDPLPKWLEARESATPEAPALAKAARQLNRYAGTPESKLRWVYDNEDLIVATALADSDVTTERAFHAKILELMHRYYRHECVERKPRPPRFESFERQKQREGDAFWENLRANGYRLTGS